MKAQLKIVPKMACRETRESALAKAIAFIQATLGRGEHVTQPVNILPKNRPGWVTSFRFSMAPLAMVLLLKWSPRSRPQRLFK